MRAVLMELGRREISGEGRKHDENQMETRGRRKEGGRREEGERRGRKEGEKGDDCDQPFSGLDNSCYLSN